MGGNRSAFIGSKIMQLNELLIYDKIFIQCHDAPDADTISSGFALYKFFEKKGKDVTLFYSGPRTISKPNLLILIESLEIPIEHKLSGVCDGLLIVVDSQYGSSNVTEFGAEAIAIIDHHEVENRYNIALANISPKYGSCSSLVWKMLQNEGFDFDEKVGTALYFGLLTDTNNFRELRHPVDKDMRENIPIDEVLIRRMLNSNLNLDDIEKAAIALLRVSQNMSGKFAVIKSKPCDPNLLGVISDIAIQVDIIEVSVVYSISDKSVKFSVRSCVDHVMANDLARYIVENIGNGGGHIDKAGGLISIKQYERHYEDINFESFFLSKIKSYYEDYQLIYNVPDDLNLSDIITCHKKANLCGYYEGKYDFDLTVRTFDEDIFIEKNTPFTLVIDTRGKVHKCDIRDFEKDYIEVDGLYKCNLEYTPHIIDEENSYTVKMLDDLRACVPNEKRMYMAKRLKSPKKIFMKHSSQKYLIGNIGDYLIISEDKKEVDLYTEEEFFQTYEIN